MISDYNRPCFKNKIEITGNCLFLVGPIGTFFARVSNYLELNNFKTFKILFPLHEYGFKKSSLIKYDEDIYYFNQEMDTPNFFGSRKVVSEIVYLNNKTKDIKIDNKIVCISSADPGYDFIFNYNIVGLVTEYGGVNSHMSIRCAELNIPAAIGVGNIIFNKVINSKKIHLDPETKQIDYIE